MYRTYEVSGRCGVNIQRFLTEDVTGEYRQKLFEWIRGINVDDNLWVSIHGAMSKYDPNMVALVRSTRR